MNEESGIFDLFVVAFRLFAADDISM